MIHVSLKHDVEAPAGAVWDLVGDLRNASLWPVVLHCEVRGSGVGCERTLDLVGDERLRERLESHDDRSRSYRSEVLELGRLPLRDFHYSVSVAETGPDRCAIEWDADFEPAGVTEDRAREIVRGFYANVTVSIRDRLGV